MPDGALQVGLADGPDPARELGTLAGWAGGGGVSLERRPQGVDHAREGDRRTEGDLAGRDLHLSEFGEASDVDEARGGVARHARVVLGDAGARRADDKAIGLASRHARLHGLEGAVERRRLDPTHAIRSHLARTVGHRRRRSARLGVGARLVAVLAARTRRAVPALGSTLQVRAAAFAVGVHIGAAALAVGRAAARRGRVATALEGALAAHSFAQQILNIGPRLCTERPRLGRWLPVLVGRGKRVHRLIDRSIAGTAAEVALEPSLHLLCSGLLSSGEQAAHGQREARRAVAALCAIALCDLALDRAEALCRRTEAFSCNDVRAVEREERTQTRVCEGRSDLAGRGVLPANHHCARAAASLVAANLGARQIELLAEVGGECRVCI